MSIFHLHIFHHFARHRLPLRSQYEILLRHIYYFLFLQNCELVNDQPRNGVTPSSSRAREEMLQLYQNSQDLNNVRSEHWPRPTASRLRPDYLADFLPEKIWRTFYNEVLPDFLAYYFPHSLQINIFSYLIITNWPNCEYFLF
jgi:hypothetical protein